MSRDPLLKRLEYTEGNTRVVLKVHGGLHYIKGNSAPYFSLTGDGYENGRESFGGACHEVILERAPEFADLAALHLSDIDGVPMHALANGFYYLGGSLVTDSLSRKSPNFSYAAKHFRITEEEARQLVRDYFGDYYSETAGFLARNPMREAKERLSVWVEAQRDRWKEEARRCIEKHSLVVYGDANKWPF